MPARRPGGKRGPDAPDLPARLDPAPDRLPEHDLLEGVHAGAELSVDAELDAAEVRESVLAEVDLSGRVLRGFAARDVRFERCDLSGALLDSASLQRVEFVGCRMTGTVLSAASLTDVVVTECRADLANLRMARASYLLVDRTSLREAEFYSAALERSALLDCDLGAANFSAASLTEVDLHGCDLDGVRGATSLAGASIAPEQIIPLATALLADTGIAVTDQPRWGVP